MWRLSGGWAATFERGTFKRPNDSRGRSASRRRQSIEPQGRVRAHEAAAGEEHVIRLKMPTEGTLVIDDLVRGRVEFELAREQDHVIQRQRAQIERGAQLGERLFEQGAVQTWRAEGWLAARVFDRLFSLLEG